MTVGPLQHSIYKGVTGKHGAVQFNFQPPHYQNQKRKDFTGEEALEMGEYGRPRPKEGWKLKEGAIFLDITSAKSPNEYDWSNKITIALSINDMGKILFTLVTGKECKLIHDPGAKTETAGAVKKFLNISSPKGTTEGVIINASVQAGGEKRSHSVPLSGEEVLVLRTLLQQAISRSLGW